MRDDAARRAILARRARFVAAALAGLGGCRGTPAAEPAPTVVTVANPEDEAVPEPDAGNLEPPEREKVADRDKDGVPDDADECPDEFGSSDVEATRLGCPEAHPMICLSEF